MSNYTGRGWSPSPPSQRKKREETDLGQNDSVQSFVLERVDLLREIKSNWSGHLPRGSRAVVTVKLGQLAIG